MNNYLPDRVYEQKLFNISIFGVDSPASLMVKLYYY